jgi:hypothetical protein
MNTYTEGIDLKYRPSSYFWAREHGIPLVSDIKGAERRRYYQRALDSGELDEDGALQLLHALTEDQRRAQGSIHPAFMGGEYLPDHLPGEVEIARITIASTTQDVTCVYARQVGKRIHYRVVDEYEGMTLEGPSERKSALPLTLQQLTDFFPNCWRLTDTLEANYQEHGYPRDEVHGFIVDASSSFYAEFGTLVHARVEEWLDKVEPEAEDENDEDEELNDE